MWVLVCTEKDGSYSHKGSLAFTTQHIDHIKHKEAIWVVCKTITNFRFYPVQNIPSHPKRLFNGKRRTLQSWWWPSCDVPQHSASIIQCWEAADLFWEGGKHPVNGCVMPQFELEVQLCVCVGVCMSRWGGGRWGLLTELELSFHTGEFISLDLPVSLPFLHTQPGRPSPTPTPTPPLLLLYSCCDVGQNQRGKQLKIRWDATVWMSTRVSSCVFFLPSALFLIFFFFAPVNPSASLWIFAESLFLLLLSD